MQQRAEGSVQTVQFDTIYHRVILDSKGGYTPEHKRRRVFFLFGTHVLTAYGIYRPKHTRESSSERTAIPVNGFVSRVPISDV